MMGFILMICSVWITNVFTYELISPEAIYVSDGDILRTKSIYFDNEIYDPYNSKQTMIRMTGRVLCINDICSIPGPTLIVNPGITFSFELENLFDVKKVNFSDVKGPDVTNIHSHGLHISGEQDNAFESVYPTQTTTSTWTIHPEHHLGTNWYHAHHHHSTTIDVMGGMYGALIVESSENCKDLDYNKPDEMHDYVLHISWQFLHDNERYCGNCDNYNDDTSSLFEYMDSFKLITSLCGLWCNEFTPEQRYDFSGFEYDVYLADGVENNIDKVRIDEDDSNDYPAFEGYLVNNQFSPTIENLQSNEYYKLRIISASAETYTQLEFDYNSETDCEYYMIARDGIALRDVSRDLSKEPYFGYFILPPGGRIDVKILCKSSGIALIKHQEHHPYYPLVNESYPMARINEQILFKLSIESSSSNNNNKVVNLEHLDYPEPVRGFPYYLTELLDHSNDTPEYKYSECPCSNYNRSMTEDSIIKHTDYCGFEFFEGTNEYGGYEYYGQGVHDLFEVNGNTFNASNPLYIISLNKIYEFYINSDGHPFHIHINPFMVQEDLLNGYIAKKYDWMDTLGYRDYNKNGFKIKYNTADFTGNVILHCHFLGHEDLGMMAFLKIVDGPTDDLEQCKRDYGFQNDLLVENGKNNGGGRTKNGNSYGKMTRKFEPLSESKQSDVSSIDFDYKSINEILFVMIIIACILNCFVRYINSKSYSYQYQRDDQY